jgi:hypothetical protein
MRLGRTRHHSRANPPTGGWSPLSARVLTGAVIAVCVIGAAAYVLAEPGPNAWIVLIQRYSIWPIVFTALAVALVVGLYALPSGTRWALILAAWWTLCIAVWQRWDLGTPRRAIRRCVIRARWPSVVRACNLGTTGDRRSPD